MRTRANLKRYRSSADLPRQRTMSEAISVPITLSTRRKSVEAERLMLPGQVVRIYFNPTSGTYTALVNGRWCYERYESDRISQLIGQINADIRRRR